MSCACVFTEESHIYTTCCLEKFIYFNSSKQENFWVQMQRRLQELKQKYHTRNTAFLILWLHILYWKSATIENSSNLHFLNKKDLPEELVTKYPDIIQEDPYAIGRIVSFSFFFFFSHICLSRYFSCIEASPSETFHYAMQNFISISENLKWQNTT